MTISRNTLLAIIIVLTAGIAVAGYALYEEKKRPDGLEISIGKDGVSIEGK